MKTLVYGEVLFDVYPDKACIGGAAFNFASHLVLEGADVSLLTAVGRDDLGRKAKEYMVSYGIDVSRVLENGFDTGRVTVTLDSKGVPSYLVHTNTSYDNIVFDDGFDFDSLKEYDVLYFGTLIQRSDASRKSLRRLVSECKFSQIFCDVNLRKNCYDRDSVRFCLENATVLKISDEEEPILRELGMYNCAVVNERNISEAICNAYPNVKLVIITLGSKGSYVYESVNVTDYYQGVIDCDVVSTVGAGDSFGAAFMAAFCNGMPINECLRRGAVLSSYVVAHAEAVPEGRPEY